MSHIIRDGVLALAAGASPTEASHLANRAAGLVVRRLGNAAPTPAELLAALDAQPRSRGPFSLVRRTLPGQPSRSSSISMVTSVVSTAISATAVFTRESILT